MPDLTGQTLSNRYRVDAFIDRGGMADVYRGFDLNRQSPVALKFMRPDFAEDLEFERRFRKEARVLKDLAHPSIVRFYELVRADDHLFMVMDFVDGVTLRKQLFRQGGVLSMSEVMAILTPIAAALHYAHTQGTFHRDIKPGNIMLSKDGRALLTDFGIAKLADSATVTAVQAGTPAYMSPEQCAGRTLDARSDVYALGVLAYELLAGRRPFVGESPGVKGTTTAESIRVEQLSVPPPRARDLNPDLPAQVGQVLARVLAKRRAKRYGSTLEFMAALEQALSGVPVEKPRVPTAPSPPTPAPTPTPAPPPPTPPAPSVKAAPAARVADQPARSQTVMRWLLGAVAAVALLVVGIRILTPPTVIEVEVEQVVDVVEPGSAVVQDFNRGMDYFFQGLHNNSDRWLTSAIAEYSKAIELDSQYARAYHARGVAYTWLGEYEKAIADYGKVIELDPQFTPLAYYERGHAYGNLGEHDKAVADYRKAIELDSQFSGAYTWHGEYEKAVAEHAQGVELDSYYARAYRGRGAAYSWLGEHERAITDYNKAIELDPEFAEAYKGRGDSYTWLDEWERAITDYNKATELDPEFAEAYKGRGSAYTWLDEYQRAIADYGKAIELDPADAQAYYGRGKAYSWLEEFEKATTDYDKAIELDPEFAEAYFERGSAYSWLKEYQRAIADYNRVLNLTSHPDIVEAAEDALEHLRE